MRACLVQLGRSPESAAGMVDTLRDNWYETAGDVAKLTEAQAVALRLPLRLLHMMQSLLLQHGSACGASAPEIPDAQAAGEVLKAAGGSSGTADADSAAAPLLPDEPLSAGVLATAVSLAEKVNAAMPEVEHRIELRRCPNRESVASNGYAVRVTSRTRLQPYALKASELPGQVQAELEAFFRWCTVRFFGAQADPIQPVTARKYIDHMRGMLGWLVLEKGVPLEEVSLRHAIPTPERQGVAVAFEYLQWLHDVRGVNVRTKGLVIRSIMASCKFLYHVQSTARPGEGDRPYSDLEVVRELRGMANTAKREAKVAGRASDESLKWLDWPQYLAVVEQLRHECGALDANGKPRPERTVAWSLQRYLIFAILSCVPDRQRTLRELRVGKTLLKEGDTWVIRHSAADYKTGRSYGERPPLILAHHISPELEAFIDTWRAKLDPQHDFLFTRRDGLPLDDRHVYKIFWTAVFRLTGQKMNPHLVRDSCVSYLRGDGNASERELEALAIYMGHSVAMQRDTYDRRSLGQKVAPAVELLASLNRRASK